MNKIKDIFLSSKTRLLKRGNIVKKIAVSILLLLISISIGAGAYVVFQSEKQQDAQQANNIDIFEKSYFFDSTLNDKSLAAAEAKLRFDATAIPRLTLENDTVKNINRPPEDLTQEITDLCDLFSSSYFSINCSIDSQKKIILSGEVPAEFYDIILAEINRHNKTTSHQNCCELNIIKNVSQGFSDVVVMGSRPKLIINNQSLELGMPIMGNVRLISVTRKEAIFEYIDGKKLPIKLSANEILSRSET